jgi:hypothetical protein
MTKVRHLLFWVVSLSCLGNSPSSALASQVRVEQICPPISVFVSPLHTNGLPQKAIPVRRLAETLSEEQEDSSDDDVAWTPALDPSLLIAEKNGLAVIPCQFDLAFRPATRSPLLRC